MTLIISCQSNDVASQQEKSDTSIVLNIMDTVKAEIYKPSAGELRFQKFWTKFALTGIRSDRKTFKTLSLDSLRVCDSIMSVENFIKKCFADIFDKRLLSSIVNKSKVKFAWNKIDSTETYEKLNLLRGNKDYMRSHVEVSKNETDTSGYIVSFYFINTNSGYRLFKCSYNKNRQCCR